MRAIFYMATTILLLGCSGKWDTFDRPPDQCADY